LLYIFFALKAQYPHIIVNIISAINGRKRKTTNGVSKIKARQKAPPVLSHIPGVKYLKFKLLKLNPY